jgi:hypothetical protein
MMKRVLDCRIIIALSLLFFGNLAQAQTIAADTTFSAKAQNHAVYQYRNAMQSQQRIYTGRDYNEYISHNQEHPYFLSGDYVAGKIQYDSDWFENIPLLYDLNADKLIGTSAQGAPMELVKEKVNTFSIENHQFVHIQGEPSVDAGFYELLYNGPTRVVCKHVKRFQETIQGTKYEKRFDESSRIYVYHGGKFSALKSKKALFKLLGDKKEDLRSYARKNRIRFKADRQNSIIKLAQFYDLSNS